MKPFRMSKSKRDQPGKGYILNPPTDVSMIIMKEVKCSVCRKRFTAGEFSLQTECSHFCREKK